ncbi:hypothetical protein C1645_743007 [Glomus cerebriforme]|uniref:Uncharacterized protein n=1 Tax=Glomus cerebriforme TaxID=658196 RepID=A0A397SB07_9GLOM|nr:hypothetical protein C1645_743007 [Glomus cerebriforme]
MLTQPGGEQVQNIEPSDNTSLSNPDQYLHSLFSSEENKSWEVFRFFVHVHMWDGFVYLFLLVWNSEPDNLHLDYELNLIGGHLLNLHKNEGFNKDKNSRIDEIIKQFKTSRATMNEVLRTEVMNKVHQGLSFQSIYPAQLSNLIHLLNSMNSLQKQALRHVFISRIYGYSKFAEYLSKEWENRLANETNENSQLLQKEQNRKMAETNIKQILSISDLNNQSEKSYADVVKLENNIIDKTKEIISKSSTNEDSNKNLEIIKPVPDSTHFEPEKKLEIIDINKIKKEEKKSLEFVDNEKLSEEKGVESGTIDKEDNIETNASVISENTSKGKFKNDRKLRPGSRYRREENTENNNRSRRKSTKQDPREHEIRENQRESPKVEKLQQEISLLRQEAASHQAALGEIMNIGWRDNDSNNSMQLTKDIEKLQKDLENFTRVKRKGIDINFETANNLLRNCKCKTLIENKMNGKIVLSAALQQDLINYTLSHTNDYFKGLNDLPNKTEFISDDKLEAAIFSRTNELIELTKRFAEVNTGTDAHTKLLPIKIRQHIYAALGQRSFNSNNPLHPLIDHLVNVILSRMNKYRTVDDERNKKINSEVAPIIRQILHLFYFRLQTQEPNPTIKFYQSGDEFDPGVMEPIGQIEKSDEEFEELEVEICSFPVVALLENLDEEERKVFTKAQVIVRPKKST